VEFALPVEVNGATALLPSWHVHWLTCPAGGYKYRLTAGSSNLVQYDIDPSTHVGTFPLRHQFLLTHTELTLAIRASLTRSLEIVLPMSKGVEINFFPSMTWPAMDTLPRKRGEVFCTAKAWISVLSMQQRATNNCFNLVVRAPVHVQRVACIVQINWPIAMSTSICDTKPNQIFEQRHSICRTKKA
jgi:hypothetical protein